MGDTPSNCSYHLRTLARHGLVEAVESADRRQRPWRATITGFTLEPDADPATASGRGTAAVMAASLALQQRLLRDYLSHRDTVPAAWREVDLASNYTLRITPDELRVLGEQLDALIRPLIAAGPRVRRPPTPSWSRSTCSPSPGPRPPWRRADP